MIYCCAACSEPVSDDLLLPVLEDGVVIVCLKCVLDKVYNAPMVMIEVPRNEAAINQMLSNELEALEHFNFKEIK